MVSLRTLVLAALAIQLLVSSATAADDGAVAGTSEAAATGGTSSASGTTAERGACYRIDAGHLACYDKPRLFGFALNAPGDIGRWVKGGFRRENLAVLAGIAVATAGLLVLDQDLSRRAHDLGRWAHISSDGEPAKAPGVPIPYPTDVGSGLYYLGDGMVPVSLAVGMLGYGLVTSDTRVLQTTSHLVEGLVSVALVAQTVKHITGRESPSRATESGGAWRPFTDPTRYQKNVPAFDAFPSGHLATAMVTVTVLAGDYPEYWLIRPVGYGLMTLLGFQMMNNDVHWASDYPLAIAMGYGLGRQAVSRGRRVVADAGAPGEPAAPERGAEVTVLPVPFQEGGGGLLVTGRF